MTDSEELTCADCDTLLVSGPGAGAAFPTPCPACGSRNQKLQLAFHDDASAKIHDLMDLKAKDDSYPSKSKLRQHIIQGSELRKSVGDYVEKERVIDKDNNIYREYITDKDGNVIRSVEESLKDHFGRGSAKFKGDLPKS